VVPASTALGEPVPVGLALGTDGAFPGVDELFGEQPYPSQV